MNRNKLGKNENKSKKGNTEKESLVRSDGCEKRELNDLKLSFGGNRFELTKETTNSNKSNIPSVIVFSDKYFWLVNYVKRILNNGYFSKSIIDFVFSFGSSDDRREFIDKNRSWIFLKTDNSISTYRKFFNTFKKIDDNYDVDIKVLFNREVVSGLINRVVNLWKNDEEDYYKIHKKVVRSLLEYLNKTVPKNYDLSNSYIENTLLQLKEIFNLSNVDISIIRLYYYLGTSQLANIFSDYLNDYGSIYNFVHISTGISHRKLYKSMDFNSPLFIMGFFGNSVNEDDMGYSLDYSIRDDLISCLNGHISIKDFLNKILILDKGSVYKISSFSQVNSDSIFILKKLLKSENPVKVLIYGPTGTGKTEFVRSICKDCNLLTYFLSKGNGNLVYRRQILEIANQILLDNNSVIIVDEAESIFGHKDEIITYLKGVSQKDFFSNFIDSIKVKMIFILNDIDFVENSILRRFNYSIKFEQKTSYKDLSNFKKILRKNSLDKYLSDAFIDRISNKYNLTPSSLNNAVKIVNMVVKSEKNINSFVVENYFENVLSSYEKMVYKKFEKNICNVTDKYDINLINTDIPVNSILISLENYLNNLNDNNLGNVNFGVNLLFWGLPGTGKTEFVKYLSNRLKVRLIIRRGSDLLSPYVGVTENLISQSFEEASRDRSILLIDEADSFFIHRDTLLRSWEITQTNEFLNQMENHNCILICCTNLIKNLDFASLRRFHWKVEFRPLNSEQRILVFKKYFPNKINELVEEKLFKLEGLVLGDFKVVYNKFMFNNLNKVDGQEIVEALYKEVEYRKFSMGKVVHGFK